MKNYYDILGVSPSSSEEDIRKAFKKLSLQYHPDRPTGDEAKFKELSEAYNILTNKQKRQEYDMGGQQYSGFDPFDGFDQMFTDMFGGGFRFSFRGNNTKRVQPLDVATEITIEELYNGTQKEINFTRQKFCYVCDGVGFEKTTCSECNGLGSQVKQHGNTRVSFQCRKCYGKGASYDHAKACKSCGAKGVEVEQAQHTVDLPPGAGHVSQTVIVNIDGIGNEANGKRGPVNLHISVKPHSRYGQDGLNLIVYQDIKITDFILGNKVNVDLPDKSNIALKIAPGSSPHVAHKIQKKGFQQLSSKVRGDLIIKLNLVVPDNLTSEQEKLIKKLKTTGL